jgi:hypothetical protein
VLRRRGEASTTPTTNDSTLALAGLISDGSANCHVPERVHEEMGRPGMYRDHVTNSPVPAKRMPTVPVLAWARRREHAATLL